MDADKLTSLMNSNLDKLKNKEFKECVKISRVDIRPLTDQALVIVSEINRITITLELKNGKTKELKAVAKFEPTAEMFIKLVTDIGGFEMETLMYQKILVGMEELIGSSEAGREDDILWPESYFCYDKKFILQDLNVLDYRIVPAHEMLDVEHAKLTLKAIGSFHALGLVLKERGVFDTKEITINLLIKNLPFVTNFHEGSVKALAKNIEETWGPEWKGVPDKLRKSADNLGEKLKQLVISNDGKCNVLCHGDFTIRNLLFHYKDDGKTPDRVKFIDFQGTNWSNLGFDLVVILSTSMFPQVREKNLDDLLGTYAESLTSSCKRYGYKGYVPTLDDIYQVYDSLGYLSLVYTSSMIPALVAARDSLNVDSLFEDNKGGDDKKNETFQTSYLQHHLVHDALIFELQRCLKKNIL